MIQNLNIYLWNMKVGSLVAYKKGNRQGLIFQLLGDSSVVPLGLKVWYLVFLYDILILFQIAYS